MKNNSAPDNANGLQNIKRIVVLMFENRSFDHLFGDFPKVNGLFDNEGKFKEDCYNLREPLIPSSGKNPKYFPAPVNASAPLAHDFTHDFGDGMMPDLFGPTFTIEGKPPLPSNYGANYTSGYTKQGPVGQIKPTPATYPATNSGFYTTYNSCKQQGQSALSYFKNATLEVLHQLAGEFVLCDNYHCDMPGHTLPNRAFMHCGTTGTTGIDDTDGGMVDSNAIFDLIDQQSGISQPPNWKMYAPVDSNGNLGQLDTRFLNSDLQSYAGVPITQFADDCNAGTLPFYSFIMCWLPKADAYTDTSMHPASMIQPGENLLAAVYNTLRNSPCWNDTLLVINFDENGGIYDHVFPPTTTPPDPEAPPATQSTVGCCGNDWTLNSTFDFSLLGFRVPALLISPWLARGIDNTQYQNTSVLRFIIDAMNANYGTSAAYLTSRDASAPSLDSAFSQFGQSAMRTDCPGWITPYPTLPCVDPATGSNAIPYCEGKLTAWTPPAGTDAAPPVDYINELMNIYVSPLPGHPDSGKTVTRTFSTNAEVTAYIKERMEAAGH
jgi:phospholipase C